MLFECGGRSVDLGELDFFLTAEIDADRQLVGQPVDLRPKSPISDVDGSRLVLVASGGGAEQLTCATSVWSRSKRSAWLSSLARAENVD